MTTTDDGELSALLRAVAEAPAVQPGYRRSQPLEGRTVGRLRIERELGAGGMGVVYRAHHLDLDRTVAVKVHFAKASTRARQRLLREARWMARLSHPNVVTIHDVGTIDDQVFIAMEFLDGGTLRKWLRDHPRRPSEIIEVFAAAGRGLAAAHAAGLVHRDFKPDNVLLGRGPRGGDTIDCARVADFGLAQEDHSTPERGTDPEHVQTPASTGSRLTRTGDVAGTPAYMAPEQHMGRATPRSDQFAFCVALYEALYGVRPYRGDTVGELLVRISERRLETPANRPRVSRRLERALRRGLDPDEAARHAAMDDLLAALSPPVRPRGAILGGVAVLALAALVGTVAWPRSDAACGADPLAGIWGTRERDDLAARFAAQPEAWPRLETSIDASARSLAALADELCHASHHELATADRDRQRACIDAERRRLRGVLEVVGSGDIDATAVAQVEGDLPPVDACRDLERLREGAYAPSDPSTAQRVADIDEALAKVVALEHANRYSDARTLAEETLAAAQDLGDPRTEAEALLRVGDLLLRQTDIDAATARLEEAYYRAAAADYDAGMADAAILLARAHGRDAGHFEPGLAWLRRAEVALDRLADDSRYRVDFEATAGTVHEAHGDLVDAEMHYRRALEAVDASSGDDDRRRARLRGVAWAGIGRALDGQGRTREAIEAYRESNGLFAVGTNPNHPSVAANLNNMAAALYDLERYDEAIVLYERAIAIVDVSLGPDSGMRGTFLGNLANAYTALGRHEEAITTLEAALAILEREYGPEHVEVSAAIGNMARIERKRGNLQRSRELFERAIASLEVEVGAAHPDVGDKLLGYAATLRDMGDAEGALRQSRRALELATDDDRPMRARAELDVGLGLLALGDDDEAVAAVERSLAIGFGDGDAHIWAEANFALARALVRADPRQRERAVELARRAQPVLAHARSLDDLDDATSVDAWLAEHDR